MKFEIPDLEIVTFDHDDILTASESTTERELIGYIPPGGLPLD